MIEFPLNDAERDLLKLDPAWGKAAYFFRSNIRLGHGDLRCRSLLEVWQDCEIRRERYEQGDTNEVLHVVKLCAEENLPLPQWAAMAFSERFTATLKPGGVTSLDEAFSARQKPKTAQKKNAENRDWQQGGKVWLKVWEVLLSDESLTGLDPALERVLRENPRFSMAKTKARELVLLIDQSQKTLNPKHQAFSELFKKRRKQ